MCYEKQRHLLRKIQEARNIICRTISQSPSNKYLGTSPSSPNISSTVQNSAKYFVAITISCPIIFSWIPWMVWNLFPFKGDFSFGKSQKSQGTKSGLQRVGRPSNLGDLMFHQKTLQEIWYISRCVVLMKLPIISCPYLWSSESSK